MQRKLLNLGTWLLGLGLVGLGVHAFCAPSDASMGYGVRLEDDNPAYIIATGMRDLALGLATLGVFLKHRAVLLWLLGPTLLIPLSDVFLVLKHGEGTLLALAPHLVGVVGIAVLWFLAVRESRGKLA